LYLSYDRELGESIVRGLVGKHKKGKDTGEKSASPQTKNRSQRRVELKKKGSGGGKGKLEVKVSDGKTGEVKIEEKGGGI